MPGNKPTPWGNNLYDDWETHYGQEYDTHEAIPYRWIEDPVLIDDLKQGYVNLEDVRPIEGKPEEYKDSTRANSDESSGTEASH